jgi:hypothetical protein
MAAITSLILARAIESTETRGSETSHTGVWRAKTDEAMVGDHVLAHAREQVGTLPAGAEPVPYSGDALFFVGGKVQIPPVDPGAWATANPSGYFDLTSYALDFAVIPVNNNRTIWDITVTWRQPVPGLFEAPQFQALYNSPSFASLPDTDPLFDAATERWLEFASQQYEASEARIVTRLVPSPPTVPTVSAEPVPMLMPNREPYEPIYLTANVPTLVISSVVKNYWKAIELDTLYGGTVNNAAFTSGGASIAAFVAAYENSVTSNALRHKGGTYYRMETRIRLKSNFHFHNRAAIASSYLDAGLTTAAFTQDGIPIDRFPLDVNGDWIELSGLPAESKTFCPLRPASYAAFAEAP